jgi:hypothetical protein
LDTLINAGVVFKYIHSSKPINVDITAYRQNNDSNNIKIPTEGYIIHGTLVSYVIPVIYNVLNVTGTPAPFITIETPRGHFDFERSRTPEAYIQP